MQAHLEGWTGCKEGVEPLTERNQDGSVAGRHIGVVLDGHAGPHSGRPGNQPGILVGRTVSCSSRPPALRRSRRARESPGPRSRRLQPARLLHRLRDRRGRRLDCRYTGLCAAQQKIHGSAWPNSLPLLPAPPLPVNLHAAVLPPPRPPCIHHLSLSLQDCLRQLS
jgi:hypothetical protein